jgi:hypothetical protein
MGKADCTDWTATCHRTFILDGKRTHAIFNFNKIQNIGDLNGSSIVVYRCLNIHVHFLYGFKVGHPQTPSPPSEKA